MKGSRLNKLEDYGTLIYKCYAGSKSYGTNITEEMAKEKAHIEGGEWRDYVSDVDVRGIFIPHNDFLYGSNKVDEFKDPNEEDAVYFSLEKFLRLALEGNPNVVEQLFVREEDVIFMRPIGKELRDNRNWFISKNAFGRFGSYAYSQLKRMTTQFEEFKRNKKRQKLIEATNENYDPKNAMHLVRLFQMGNQILSKGTLDTYRPNRDELLKIRNGKYTLEEIKEYAEELNTKLEDSMKKSTIPNVPDFEVVNSWMINSIDSTIGGNKNIGVFQSNRLSVLPVEYEMIDKTTLFLVSNPLVRKVTKSQAQGLLIPHKDWFIGLRNFSEFKFDNTTIEHLHKFIQQVRSCNPRHVDAIFAPEDKFLHKHPMSDELILKMRTLLTTKRAFNTAQGYIKGNLKKMEHWENQKKEHEVYRQSVLDAKKLTKEFWEKQLEPINNQKEMFLKKHKEKQELLLEKIIKVTSIDEKEKWQHDFDALHHEYRLTLDKLKEEKDKLIRNFQKWEEMKKKKGNIPTYPPMNNVANPNASVMGKFGYDTILASELYHYANLFIELLKTGTIKNSRAFESEMYAIKHGKYKTFNDFKSLMLSLLDKLVSASEKSNLGNDNYKDVQSWMIDFIQRYYKTLN